MLGRADRELTAAEHYRLDVGPITAGHHRTGLLRTASGMVCGRDRGPPARARAALAGTDVPIDKILAPLGVQRLDRRGLCRHGCLDTADGDVAVESSTMLALDGNRVAVATGQITGEFCRPVAANSPDMTSLPPALP